jgi:hypothetical protein
MKKTFIAIALLLFFIACKKTKESIKTAPVVLPGETLPLYDNTAFGIYKGYFLKYLTMDPSANNSIASGNIKMAINNGTNVVKAYIAIGNSIKDTLTCAVPIVLGQNIDRVLFLGTISSLRFSVNADGTNPVVSEFVINGKWNDCKLRHETSTQQVEVYENTFTASNPAHVTEQGQLDFIKIGDSLLFTQQFIYASTYYGTGLSTANSFTLTNNYFNFSGNISTVGCSGTWQLINQIFIPLTGTFNGVKTL